MILRGTDANIPPFVDFALDDDAVKRMKTTLPPLYDMAYCAHVLLLAKQSFELGTVK